jgi:hypothetical protein
MPQFNLGSAIMVSTKLLSFSYASMSIRIFDVNWSMASSVYFNSRLLYITYFFLRSIHNKKTTPAFICPLWTV